MDEVLHPRQETHNLRLALGNIENIAPQDVKRWSLGARSARISKIRSILTNGLQPPNMHQMSDSTATRNGTVNDVVAEEGGISGALIFREDTLGVQLKVDPKKPTSFSAAVAGSEETVKSEYFYTRKVSDLTNPPNPSAATTTVVDAIVDGVLYGKAYYGGMHSILPVLAERRGESMADYTRYLNDSLLGRRSTSSFLMVADFAEIGAGKGDYFSQTEYRVHNRSISPKSVKIILASGEIYSLLSELKEGLGLTVDIREVPTKKAIVPIGHTLSETEVPDYEEALRKLGQGSDGPLFVHGVRLPDETDFALAERTELKRSVVQFDKFIRTKRWDKNPFDDAEITDTIKYYGDIFGEETIVTSLKALPTYRPSAS